MVVGRTATMAAVPVFSQCKTTDPHGPDPTWTAVFPEWDDFTHYQIPYIMSTIMFEFIYVFYPPSWHGSCMYDRPRVDWYHSKLAAAPPPLPLAFSFLESFSDISNFDLSLVRTKGPMGQGHFVPPNPEKWEVVMGR